MPLKRDPCRKDPFYLPKYQFRTAVNFCLQYKDLKAEYATMDGRRGMIYDDMPHGTGTTDPTMSVAEARMRISNKIDIIEGAVKTVSCYSSKRIATHLLLAVTEEGMTYKELQEKYKIPVDRPSFSRYRRMIYWIVAQKI